MSKQTMQASEQARQATASYQHASFVQAKARAGERAWHCYAKFGDGAPEIFLGEVVYHRSLEIYVYYCEIDSVLTVGQLRDIARFIVEEVPKHVQGRHRRTERE